MNKSNKICGRAWFVLVLLTYVNLLAAQKFDATKQPTALDYSKETSWSTLPFRQDAADFIPDSETWVNDSLKDVDVFYIYPTIYMNGKTWNADATKKKLNKKIDKYPVKYHASVFNASARVYTPRYRQAVIKAFYRKEEGTKALTFAYQDVKKAFEYYLKHYNNGRPIIIASHSQGTYHARTLLSEFFDTTTLRNRLVAAYVIGFAIYDTMYANLKPCLDENQTGCYITWASYKKGVKPLITDLAGNVVVNPITWTNDNTAASASKSKGGVLLNLNKKYYSGAQIHNNVLWVKTKTPIIRSMTNMHVADYNLFWYDIRQNVQHRIDLFWKR
jgi:hypothetical protein